MFGIKLSETHWQRRLLGLAAGLAFLGAIFPFQIYPLAWLAPILLFFSFVFTPLPRAFRAGYFFGLFYSLVSLYWLGYVTAGGWIALCFYLALFWGVLALGVRYLLTPVLGSAQLRYRVIFAAGSAGLWVVLEWLKVNMPHISFGVDLLSYSQAPFLPFIQIAEWIGAYGISFIMALCSSLIFVALLDIFRRVKHCWSHSIFYVSFVLALFLGVLVHGIFALKTDRSSGQSLQVGIIQGNIPQALKWDPEVKTKIIEKYVKLSELLIYDHPDMVVWPEASYPGFLLPEIRDAGIEQLIQKSKVPYLIGSPRMELSGQQLYNSALWFSDQGEFRGSYDKRILVPFGEYVPFKRALFFLEKIAYSMGVGDFEAGTHWQIFEGPMGSQFASLICFENLFPSMTSVFAKKGAEFFVVISNDSWFRVSRAPYEHLYTSIFRAIETRRPFVHVANTGVSGYIDADGRVVDTLRDKTGRELFVMGGMTRPVYPQKGLTFYVKWGGWFIPIVFLMFVCAAALSLRFVRNNKVA